MYKDERGTQYHRLQEDSDIIGEKGQVMSSGSGKNGKMFTLCLVSDISKNEDTVEPKRQLIKNNYDFIDPLYDFHLKKTLAVIGHHPSKTSIGV